MNRKATSRLGFAVKVTTGFNRNDDRRRTVRPAFACVAGLYRYDSQLPGRNQHHTACRRHRALSPDFDSANRSPRATDELRAVGETRRLGIRACRFAPASSSSSTAPMRSSSAKVSPTQAARLLDIMGQGPKLVIPCRPHGDNQSSYDRWVET